MKSAFYFLIAIICMTTQVAAQTNTFPSSGPVGIGTTTPNASSKLEIVSTSKGILIPRMTRSQRNAIPSPATSLLIYQTDYTPGFYYYNGNAWQLLMPVLSAANTNLSNLVSTKVNAALLPDSNNKRNLGNALRAWRNIYVDSSIYLNSLTFIANKSDNVLIGQNAGNGITSGTANTAIGDSAMFKTTTATNNTAVGDHSLFLNSLGLDNTAIGTRALYSNTGNTSKTMIPLVLGNGNSALGAYALYNNNGRYNIAAGAYSMFYNTTGSNNAAVGYNALENNIDGTGNAAYGYSSLFNNRSGYNNSAIGTNALFENKTGIENTATGYDALFSDTSGSLNVAIGAKALYLNAFVSNIVAIGDSSLYNNGNGAAPGTSDAVANTAVGSKALYSNTTGRANGAFGYQSAYLNTTGIHNTAIGYFALRTNITGNDNTAIGYGADVSVSGLNNAAAIGSGAIANASNKMQLGSSTTILATTGGVTIVSDGRFKEQIKQTDVPGLEFINKLKPVTYNFNYKSFDDFLKKHILNSSKPEADDAYQKLLDEKSKKRELGFVAQDVEKLVKDNNYTFNGVYTPQNSNDNYALDYSRFVVPLVKAVQELSHKDDSLQDQNNAQQNQIDNLQNQINELKALINPKISSSGITPGKHAAEISFLLGANQQEATLSQNIPNPFSNTTNISYFIPQQSKSAQIIVTNKNGSTIKTIAIAGAGKGSTKIDALTLAAGAYQYSLYVNNKLIDTKQMISAK